jgi:hypothetical protein
LPSRNEVGTALAGKETFHTAIEGIPRLGYGLGSLADSSIHATNNTTKKTNTTTKRDVQLSKLLQI